MLVHQVHGHTNVPCDGPLGSIVREQTLKSMMRSPNSDEEGSAHRVLALFSSPFHSVSVSSTARLPFQKVLHSSGFSRTSRKYPALFSDHERKCSISELHFLHFFFSQRVCLSTISTKERGLFSSVKNHFHQRTVDRDDRVTFVLLSDIFRAPF